jgi:hypothetical protein
VDAVLSVAGRGMLTCSVGCFVCGPGVLFLALITGDVALLLDSLGTVEFNGGGDRTDLSCGESGLMGDDECGAGAD